MIKKWAEDSDRHFSTEDTHMANVHEKMLNVTNHQGNSNQNHNETVSHTCQNGYHQKDKSKCWQRWREKEIIVHCWECK